VQRRLAIFGITGRMGQSIFRLLRTESRWRLIGAVASSSSGRLGQDVAGDGQPSGVHITSDAQAALIDAHGKKAAVAVDFSAAIAVAAHARACAAAGVPLLIGTTGLDADCQAAVHQAAKDVAVLLAPNTSVGVGVLAELARMAGAALPASFDVEIHEAHHRTKRDAPSGTALKLGEIIAQARGRTLAEVAVYDRHGAQPGAPGSIGFSVVRAGDIVGEHTVVFAGAGERLEITHRASDRDVFARGALLAAEWLAGRSPGLYSMRDVLHQ